MSYEEGHNAETYGSVLFNGSSLRNNYAGAARYSTGRG